VVPIETENDNKKVIIKWLVTVKLYYREIKPNKFVKRIKLNNEQTKGKNLCASKLLQNYLQQVVKS